MSASQDFVPVPLPKEESLRQKVRIISMKPGTESVLINNASQEIKKLESEFPEWMKSAIEKITELRQKIPADNKVVSAELMEKVFFTSHDLKGLAYSINYNLIGDVCDSLCDLFELFKELQVTLPTILIQQHLDSIIALYNHSLLENPEKNIAQTLVKRLRLVTNQYIEDVCKKKDNLND